ncbi:Uncharacterised protein [Vibrio cholerae]|uniref:Uncharacterized protein n=1 Tax=Vibrio cholerae TaxID=666 RepID=A0A655SFZ6_VIBCL|nr:Uncharacterised protein [Vibrio cholerae]
MCIFASCTPFDEQPIQHEPALANMNAPVQTDAICLACLSTDATQ